MYIKCLCVVFGFLHQSPYGAPIVALSQGSPFLFRAHTNFMREKSKDWELGEPGTEPRPPVATWPRSWWPIVRSPALALLSGLFLLH